MITKYGVAPDAIEKTAAQGDEPASSTLTAEAAQVSAMVKRPCPRCKTLCHLQSHTCSAPERGF